MTDFQRKKRIPGTNDLLKSIAATKSDIAHIQDRINDLRQKIQTEQNSSKTNSVRSKLISTKDQIRGEIAELKKKRDGFYARKDELLNELKSIKGDLSKKREYKSLGDIDREMRSVEAEIMRTTYTPAKEKEFQSRLLELKKRRQNFADVSEKEGALRNNEAELGELKDQIHAVTEELKMRKEEMDELDKAIDETRITKENKVIKMYDDEIKVLMEKRNALMEKKKNDIDQVKQKEIEHDKYMQEMAEQLELENKRKEQKKKIGNLNAELIALESERTKIESQGYDSVINALERMNIGRIDMSLAGRLLSEGLMMPKTEEERKRIIKILNDKKGKFKEEIKAKAVALDEKIRELGEKINEEKSALEKMPASEIKVMRK